MARKRSNPAPLAGGDRVRNAISSAASHPENALPVLRFQASFLVRRFGLSVAHAAVVASLHFGKAR